MDLGSDGWDALMVRVVVTILVAAGLLVLAGVAGTSLLMPTATLFAALGVAGYFAVTGTAHGPAQRVAGSEGDGRRSD